MAALSAENRRRIWAHVMRTWPQSLGPIPVDKPGLRAVVDAVDDWVEANQPSFNVALPQPFRGTATPEMKTFVLSCVIERRASRLQTDEDRT